MDNLEEMITPSLINPLLLDYHIGHVKKGQVYNYGINTSYPFPSPKSMKKIFVITLNILFFS